LLRTTAKGKAAGHDAFGRFRARQTVVKATLKIVAMLWSVFCSASIGSGRDLKLMLGLSKSVSIRRRSREPRDVIVHLHVDIFGCPLLKGHTFSLAPGNRSGQEKW
jgi:hypothetical protein